jgi:hypothetical protein
MRATVRAAANKVTSESDVDTYIISFASNRPRNDGFYSTSLSSTFGSRYLIRKYGLKRYAVHGYPVPYRGSRYGTNGLLTWLSVLRGREVDSIQLF